MHVVLDSRRGNLSFQDTGLYHSNRSRKCYGLARTIRWSVILFYRSKEIPVQNNRSLSPGGGGGNLTCPWYRVVLFFRLPFYDRVWIYVYGFQQFFALSGFMGIVFWKNSFIGELFLAFPDLWVYFEKFLRIYGYTFEKFLQIYGWYFYNRRTL